jgi:cation transport ATPase
LFVGNYTYLRWALTASAFLFTLPFLLRYWWKSAGKRPNGQSLAWALAITWTLVLNLYVGIYDTSLVVLSLLLTANAFYEGEAKDRWLPTSHKLILLLVYVVPWFTQPIARLTSLQIYTVVLALLGSWQLIQFQRLSKFARS